MNHREYYKSKAYYKHLNYYQAVCLLLALYLLYDQGARINDLNTIIASTPTCSRYHQEDLSETVYDMETNQITIQCSPKPLPSINYVPIKK